MEEKEFSLGLIYIEYFKILKTMKNIIKVVIALIVVSGFMISCETTTIQNLSGVVDHPTYTKNIKTIIDAKCIGCHSNGNQFPDLDTYDNVKDSALNGDLVCRMSGTCNSIMPPDGKLPDNTLKNITNWVTDNCPE